MLDGEEVFIADDDKTGEGYEEVINNLENEFDRLMRLSRNDPVPLTPENIINNLTEKGEK